MDNENDPAASPTDYASYSTLTARIVGGVLTVTLNRPDRLNAITPQMCVDLLDLVSRVHGDAAVRVVVLTGAGKAFCAGGDIFEDALEVAEMTPWNFRLNSEMYSSPMVALAELDRPTIAAVNGVAVGGGWDLALACDIRIAASGARFKDAYVQLGVMPENGGSYFLPRLAGLGRAKLISFTGDFVSAQDAERWGLVEAVVEREELDEYVATLAARISRGPAKAIAMTKLAMNRSVDNDLRDAVDFAKNLTMSLISSPDYHEALAAFQEKRAPQFDGAPPAPAAG